MASTMAVNFPVDLRATDAGFAAFEIDDDDEFESIAASRRPAYGRRRATVVLLAVIAVFALIELLSAAGSASRVALGAFGGVPASASEGTSSAASGLTPVAALPAPSSITIVVQLGDTVWSLAKQLQPTGDVRPLVQRIIDRNGGATLRVGDRLVIES